jgi:hypothetical protein
LIVGVCVCLFVCLFVCYSSWCINRVKQSLCRPGQASTVPWGEAPRFQDSWHIKLVRLLSQRTGRLYLQEIFLVLNSVGGWVDSSVIVRPEGLCHWKILMALTGIEPASWLVQMWNASSCHRSPKPLGFKCWEWRSVTQCGWDWLNSIFDLAYLLYRDIILCDNTDNLFSRTVLRNGGQLSYCR